VGIPCGGLQTGAGGIKSEEQRIDYGGMANAPYDPCYHQKCDSEDNISYLVRTPSGILTFARRFRDWQNQQPT
jgi:hypothetical protein